MLATSSNTSIMASASSFYPTEVRNTSGQKSKPDKKEMEKERRTKLKGKQKEEPHIPTMFQGNSSKKSLSGEPSQSTTGNLEDIKKETEKEKRTKLKGKQKEEPHIPTMFQGNSSKKLLPGEASLPTMGNLKDINNGESVAQSDNEQTSKGGEDETAVVANLESLVDVKKEPRRKSTNSNAGSGRPANVLMNDLVQQCYHVSRPEKPLYRCAGTCGTTYASRNLARIVRHATGCSKLDAELRKRAKAHAATQAPSRKLPIGDPESTKIQKPDGENKVKNRDGGRDVAMLKKRKADEMDWFEEAKKLGRKERHEKLDLAVVNLICCSGIPSYILDLDVWKGVFAYADPTYRPAKRAKLEEIQIIGEAESIHEIQLAYLRTQENITVSCDGGTTKGREAFWTLHMSTAGRKVFLIDVREATAVSHTAVWIKNFVLEVCSVR
jgi:hypothetical protein